MEEKRKFSNYGWKIFLAVLWGLNLWLAVKDYQTILRISHIFSPEELERMLTNTVLKGGVYAILVLDCVWQALTGMLLRPGKTAYLAEGLGCLVIGLLGGGLWFAADPQAPDTGLLAVWWAAVALSLGFGLYDLWKYKKWKNNTSN